ncbi:MAG: signal recognition particle-docking protein FtsY [Actinobacteria bacterium]|nr:signal recognition particle-docking protein FtsY [Actinomycetota bacterium]
MTRSWHEVFKGVDDTGEAAAATPAEDDEEKKSGWFSRFKESLSKSRQTMQQHLSALMFDKIDADLWERLEETLIFADCGVNSTVAIVERMEQAANEGKIVGKDQFFSYLEESIAGMFAGGDDYQIDVSHEPSVILMVGVNGTGKTTTIGKIAWHLQREGKSVVLAAADTFRAAAIEQLQEWGKRVGCPVIAQEHGSDPGAVVFDAISAARSRGADVVIVDTAGRLHTQVPLMEELKKIRRVIAKQIPDGPHETLLSVDATTGQNGLIQARLFGEAVDVTGAVLTKLDGTAKGGIAVAISHELGLPIKLVGVGEKLEDLRPFDPMDFAKALLEA